MEKTFTKEEIMKMFAETKQMLRKLRDDAAASDERKGYYNDMLRGVCYAEGSIETRMEWKEREEA